MKILCDSKRTFAGLCIIKIAVRQIVALVARFIIFLFFSLSFFIIRDKRLQPKCQILGSAISDLNPEPIIFISVVFLRNLRIFYELLTSTRRKRERASATNADYRLQQFLEFRMKFLKKQLEKT